ncbi:hypothetical protein [Microtetraspora malaysiensis]|uniref:hypothetical protein n=1 Tax=Microtetraspora malaysiensis TaxID=161358 RepID=UPI00082B9208|nr:hypothetical protein [Microtetraspora malaysiensis]
MRAQRLTVFNAGLRRREHSSRPTPLSRRSWTCCPRSPGAGAESAVTFTATLLPTWRATRFRPVEAATAAA